MLTQYDITWAAFSQAMFTGGMRWMLLTLLLGGCAWYGYKAMQAPDPKQAPAD